MVLRECAGCRYWCADKELRLCAVHLSALRRFATCPTRGGLNGHGTRVALGRGRFFCESSLFRINQWYHGLGTRLWHTPPAAVKKPTEESTRERDLGASVGRDSRYGSIYVCPPLPPGPIIFFFATCCEQAGALAIRARGREPAGVPGTAARRAEAVLTGLLFVAEDDLADGHCGERGAPRAVRRVVPRRVLASVAAGAQSSA